MTARGPRSTVSVVIPVKDDDRELARCLRALDTQTRRPDEVLVVDNGSADASATVAAAAGARVVHCASPGIPAAAAHGYDRAIGKIILRLDADCVPGPGWVDTMAAALEADPRLGAVTGGARFADGPRGLRTPLAAAYLGLYAAVGFATLGHVPLFGSNLGFRRSAWRGARHGIHRDATFHDDLDLSFHLGERYRVGFVAHAEMGISMRPFGDVRAFGHRVAGGFRTVLAHWPHDFPPVRWMRLCLRRVIGVPTFRQDLP